tara:strand:+ start:266 stop:952 length:687 start_codon:yes stop_codon:yes gene_type:complete
MHFVDESTNAAGCGHTLNAVLAACKSGQQDSGGAHDQGETVGIDNGIGPTGCATQFSIADTLSNFNGDVKDNRTCNATAAAISDAGTWYRAENGPPMVVGCDGTAFTTSNDTCQDVAATLNAMTADFHNGRFADCEVTTPTTSSTTTLSTPTDEPPFGSGLVEVFQGIVNSTTIKNYVESQLEVFGAGEKEGLAVISLVFVEIAPTSFTCGKFVNKLYITHPILQKKP